MVQGDDPFEVNSASELDEDDEMLYDEFTLFCQNFLKNMNY